MGIPDGKAVAACRQLLATERPETGRWRSTVVTEDALDGPRYVVRIWTDTPARNPRPTGTPDRVYVVKPSGADSQRSIEQVHPRLDGHAQSVG